MAIEKPGTFSSNRSKLLVYIWHLAYVSLSIKLFAVLTLSFNGSEPV